MRLKDRVRDRALDRAVATILRAIADGRMDRVAPRLATVIEQFLPANVARQYFQLWEEHGFHLTRNHYYSPIPDTRQLPDELWQRESALVGIEMNEAGQLRLLRDVFPRFAGEYSRFPLEPADDPHLFYFNNGQFGGTDALVFYCLARHYRPQTILEVGSGYSTRLATQAAALNGATRVICVEPYPSDSLRALPGVSRLITRPVQEVEPALFESLEAGDILFVDSTHVARTGGDVPFLYLEVLPRLRPGVLVHLHDIFLPQEYPKSWLTEHHLFWNEQYLLHGFLLFNAAFEVLFANHYMGLRHRDVLREVFPHAPSWEGGSWWMRRAL